MDSLTQIVLGGAVGYAVLGNKVGKKAALYGAVLGTLPDLDVFLPYAGEVEAFTYHRGFSHSIFVHLLATPFIAWLILKLHPRTVEYKKRWLGLVFLSLSTHALLDSFTVYGTQLMWPLSEYPVGFSNIFIIDPFYTTPLLVGLMAALFMKQTSQKAHKANIVGLSLSSIYIVWSLGAKVYIDNKVEITLAQHNIDYTSFVSTPAPLNTLLWRVVAVKEDVQGTFYYEIYASIFDRPEQISIAKYPSQNDLIKNIKGEWGISRLQWFTKGYYAISKQEDDIVLTDLRMGAQCYYVFNFVVGIIVEGETTLANYEKFSQAPGIDKLRLIWDRLWDPSTQISPSDCSDNTK